VDFPLRERLARATGLQVLLENDATAAVVGSYWSDAVPATVSMAGLFMGTGIGAGILVEGTVLSGARGNAGEVGHTTVEIDGPRCWCGNRGCIEAVAGPAAVVAKAREAGIDLGPADRPVLPAFTELARRSARGDAAATRSTRSDLGGDT
jgi:predicted NBD/HSP70 family sugar kinase